MKIYVASSWRNIIQPDIVKELRKVGHEVYDFKNPEIEDNGFRWSDVGTDWQEWNNESYIEGLKTPLAQKGFNKDFNAMKWADAFILVLPSGRSAHLEAGWAIGAGKPTGILLYEGEEPELMNLLADAILTTIKEVVDWLDSKEVK